MREVIATSAPQWAMLEMGDRRVLLGASLGQGLMGTVYRAVLESPQGLRRPVACKVFNAVASDEQDTFVSALSDVVARSAWIRHPNVAATYELSVGGPTRMPFVLSELVEGTTLRRLVDELATRGRRLPLDLALFIGAEIAEGLSGARTARGPDGANLAMGHTDLSPRDVLLSWHGEVKVSDFEMRRLRVASSGVRSLRKLTRRFDTMSPEVARGEDGDSRSDVFSLGIVLREMLVGPRFDRKLAHGEALARAREGVVSSSLFEPNLPKDLRAIVERAVECEPDARFPTPGAMAYELRKTALALGVADARVFLRSTLARELEAEHSQATAPGAGRPRRRG